MRRLAGLLERRDDEPAAWLSAMAKEYDPKVQIGYNPDHDEFTFSFAVERIAASFEEALAEKMHPEQIDRMGHDVLVRRRPRGA